MRTAQTEGKLNEEVLVFLLTTKCEVFARRTIAKGVLPVQRRHHLFNFLRVKPARVQATDDRTHTGARNGIDLDVKLLEDLEHAYVRCTACATSGKHEPNARAMRRPWGRWRFLDRRAIGGGLGICAAGHREPQDREKYSADPA